MITLLSQKVGYHFQNMELLTQALTHKSFYNENSEKSPGHNERLEFLGDAVIDLSLSAVLLTDHPHMSEGDLSKVRASLVNEEELAELALDLELQNSILLGVGETQSGGAAKPRLLASTFEAMIGAIYLDSGFDETNKIILKLFEKKLAQIDPGNYFSKDYKTRLQEVVQENNKKTPYYELDHEEGPDHQKQFFIKVKVENTVLAVGQGRSKKQAEQDAARLALEVSDEF